MQTKGLTGLTRERSWGFVKNNISDITAQKEEEGLYVRFQQHFKQRGFDGKFDKFNKIAQDFSKSKIFLKRFALKRILLMVFNFISKLSIS